MSDRRRGDVVGAGVTGRALRAPAAVRLVDLDQGITDVALGAPPGGGIYRSVLVVARVGGRPVGAVVLAPDAAGRLSRDRLAEAFGTELAEAGGAQGERGRPHAGDAAITGVASSALAVTVVVTTCRNPERLRRCLESLLRCEFGPFEVVVVENRPGSLSTRRMLGELFAGDARVRYVEERRPGLSFARNAGLAAASGDVVAFTDDDVVVDRGWIRHAVCALEQADEVACVAGLILPLSLETPAQVLLEQFAGFGKGFRRRVFRLPGSRAEDPLLPYTAGQVGSGANTFVRADVARRIGGFDTRLGTGTLARGGEDLDLFIRLLQAGAVIVYEPAALIWHEHLDGVGRLRRQALDYGIGLTAMLSKQLVHGPQRGELLRRVRAGACYALSADSRKNAQKATHYPRRLDALERLGMVAGPAAYAASALSASLRRA